MAASEFDPDKLGEYTSAAQPILASSQGAGGDKGGTRNAGEEIIGHTAVRNSPWGPIAEVQNTDGSVFYTTINRGNGSRGEQVAFQPDGKGGFTEQAFTQSSGGVLDGYKNNGNFWKFVGVAALGAGAAYAAGGSAGVGTYAGASEGGAAASGASAAGSAAAPISTAVPSAGGGSASSGVLGSAAAPAAGMGGSGLTTTAAGGGTLSASGAAGSAGSAGSAAAPGALDSASTWYGKLFNYAATPAGGQLIGGIVSGIGQGIASNENNKAQLENQQAQRDWAAAEAEKERRWKVRNMNAESIPTITWTPRKNDSVLPTTTSKSGGILGGYRG